MAANMRKAAKKAEFDAIKSRVSEKLKVILMKPDYYLILDGTGAIKHLEKELDQ